MAEELSRIGIAVDSKQAENSLNNIKNQLRSTAKDVKLFDEYWDKLNSTLYSAASGFTSDNALLKQMATGVKETAQGINQLNATLNSYVQGATKVYKASKKVVDEQRQMIKTTNDMAKQANRFNTGNIAAQVQDIFVTAQMNMKPLTIGLQQGTQLLYVLQQSKAPLKEFVVGIKSLFTPLSLVVVALTALVAKIIQLVDWSKIAEKFLSGIGFIFKEILSYLPFVGDAAENLGRNFSKMAEEIRNAREEASGFLSILKGFEGIEKELGEREFKLTLEGKTDLEKEEALGRRKVSEAANAQMAKMEKELGRKLTLDEIKDVELAKDAYQARLLYVIKGEDAAKKAEKAEKDRIRASKEYADTIAGLRKEYDELAISYRNKIDDIAFEKSTRGMTEEQKLVAQINHEYDQEIAKLERKVALKQIDVGLFAKEKGELDRLKEGYIESALEQEKYNESVKNFNSVMDYSSSVTKGFFSDLKKGLKDGESAWESFTNAVVNMLDKIQDKMMDLAVDAMFDSFKQSNKTGSGNWLSGIVNAGISFFTGGNNSGIIGTSSYNPATTPPSVKPTLMAANGGVFSNGVYSSPTVFKFAKGGKFGVMGEAGPEAVMPLRRGPDGSLGVKADGIGGSNVVVNVINNSNAQARTEQRQTAQGMEIDVMIDEMVGEKLARPGTSSNSALCAYNNRQLISR